MNSFFINPQEATLAMVRSAIRKRYFPEIWYVVENWLALVKNRRVLEIGSGLGLFSEALARSGWQLTCTDPSLAALMQVQARLEAAKELEPLTDGPETALHEKVEARFEQFEPDDLRFGDESYETIVSINMLEFAANQPRMIDEIYRLLKPGGKAIIGTLNANSIWSLSMFAYALRADDKPRKMKTLTRAQFKHLLNQGKFKIESMKDRIRFLPFGARLSSLSLPMTGCHLALVVKEVNRQDSEPETRLTKRHR